MDAQFAFYQSLLGLPEHEVSRSPIYCALQGAAFQFGFHAQAAYSLLDLTGRRPATTEAPVTCYATFMLDSPEQVDAAATRAQYLSGAVVKAPYPTYYGQWQAVLSDPEGNVFRVSVAQLPLGIDRPALVLPELP
jgi:predicted enzyme related to lactoylglutathione lyase